MAKVFLVAWIMMNGIWYPGEMFDGWAPYHLEGVSMEECELRLETINTYYTNVQFDCIELKE